MDEAVRALLPVLTPLPGVADEAFDRIANLVRTVIGTPVALVSLVDQNRQVFPGAAGLAEPWQTERQTPLSHSFCQYVVARHEALVIDDARVDPLLASNLAVPDLGVVAYAGMPLRDATGRVVGSLCAIDTEPRRWTTSELALLADLAHTCSAELQLRDAADRAEHAAARARLLLELSEVMSGATTVSQVGRLASKLARKRLGAESAAIAVFDVHAGVLREIGLGLDGEPGPTRRVSRSSDPSSVCLRTGQPVLLRTEAEAGSSAHLPLHLGGAVLGVLDLTWTTEQPFTDDDRELLTGFARYAAGALERATLLADRRDVAATLQQAMLPTLPSLGWVELAGVYRPANAADAVGGDWYDAFETAAPQPGDGEGCDDASRLTVVVGDVTGHDTAAAAVMGRLQAGLRHLALDTPSPPATLLSRLDRVMTATAAGPSPRMATAVVAELVAPGHPDRPARLCWSNAGHLPPLLLAPGEPARYLETTADRLLGSDASAERHDHCADLPAGSTVLVFTDGVVERRDADLDVGMDALARATAEHAHLPVAALVAAVMDTVVPGSHDDDAVLFAIRVP